MNSDANDKERDVERDDAQINGRTEGPFGSDDADADVTMMDNKRRDEVDDSANGLDSMQVRGGQDGRNNRGFGNTDMDSKNGLLRMGDMDNSTMEVTDEAQESIAGSASKSNTATVDVTTAGPDDYASADQVGVPNAESAAKEQDDDTDIDDTDEPVPTGQEQQAREEEVAETGTDLNNQPSY